MDIGKIANLLRDWKETFETPNEVGALYLFGSPIHRNGSTFNAKISDIDLVVEIPITINTPILRRNWLKNLKEKKKLLEFEFLKLLQKQDSTQQIVSILPITKEEFLYNIHKSKVSSFFSSNEFLEINSGKVTEGIPNIKFEVLTNDRIKQTIEFIQKCRNDYLKNSVTKEFQLLDYNGSDVLPKDLMRNAALVEHINKSPKKPGDDLNVNFGLTYMTSTLRELIDVDEEIELIFSEVIVRANGRGTKKSNIIDSDSHLYILEILFDKILNQLTIHLGSLPKTEINYIFGKNQIAINEYKTIEKLDTAEVIGNVAINPDGTQMAFSQDNELFIINLTAALPNYVGSHESNQEIDFSQKIELEENNSDAHKCTITAITYSRDGTCIFSSDNAGLVKCWDTISKKFLNSIDAHTDIITSIAVSSDNKYFATGSMDETIRLWELDKLKTETKLQPKIEFNKKSNIKKSHSKKGPYPHEIERFYSISFSQDGKYIASGDQKGLLVIREIETQKEVYRRKIHNSAIHSIDFSPIDSSLLATASDDTRIKLVNLSINFDKTLGLGKAKHELGLNSVAFSYKGDLLVSSATDNCIKLWDVATMELLLSHKREGGSLIDKVSFFPNKYDFTTNKMDTNISLWQINKKGDIGKTQIKFS